VDVEASRSGIYSMKVKQKTWYAFLSILNLGLFRKKNGTLRGMNLRKGEKSERKGLF